ncbi:hypothetical protein JDV02_006904 [Purpureocillium takamizusanense]|uniref:Uncharacterized protein n=1 Tax=Purpureocillium takamizusanense TaxID=2060973 RepID=A0A9Q8VBT0_9HYPO|nr:uncharacterized protein JDV02_006904 [Purpureocillium takamizusanense]UNI20855.1 hypothetical protein JDV02_006904 [Purpureocillium takamizusanense]
MHSFRIEDPTPSMILKRVEAILLKDLVVLSFWDKYSNSMLPFTLDNSTCTIQLLQARDLEIRVQKTATGITFLIDCILPNPVKNFMAYYTYEGHSCWVFRGGAHLTYQFLRFFQPMFAQKMIKAAMIRAEPISIDSCGSGCCGIPLGLGMRDFAGLVANVQCILVLNDGAADLFTEDETAAGLGAGNA